MSSFDHITFTAVASSSDASCQYSFGNETLPCSVNDEINLIHSSETLYIEFYVVHDDPHIYGTFTIDVEYLSCSITSFTLSAPAPLNCSSPTELFDSQGLSTNCIVTPVPYDIGIFEWNSNNCNSEIIQVFEDNEWVSLPSTVADLEYGIRKYQLIFETYSNPSVNVTIAYMEIAYSKLSKVYLMIHSNHSSSCQCHRGPILSCATVLDSAATLYIVGAVPELHRLRFY